MQAARRRAHAVRAALGLPWYGGRPKGRWWKAPADERERTLRQLDDLIDLSPAGPLDKPIEQWTHAELLSDASRLGLMRVREVLAQEIVAPEDPAGRPPTDVKWARLTAEMGMSAAKLHAQVQEAAMRQATDRGWDEIMARIEAAKEKQP